MIVLAEHFLANGRDRQPSVPRAGLKKRARSPRTGNTNTAMALPQIVNSRNPLYVSNFPGFLANTANHRLPSSPAPASFKP